MPITSMILDVAGRDPEQLALVGADDSLTYSELVEDSRRMFAAVDELHRAQTEPPTSAPETDGIPITAISTTSAFHTSRIIAGLAGFRAVSATIDPRWPLTHQLGVIRTTGIGVVISDSPALTEALAASAWTGTVISLADFRAREAAIRSDSSAHPACADSARAPTVRDESEPFLMLFSSGTTSSPKAFIKTRRQYRDNVAVSAAHLEPLPGVATLAPGPVSYSLTLYAVIESLATGGSVHVADEFDPIAMGRRIAAEVITRVVAVPAVVRALAEAARRDPERFTGLDLVVTGGANLPASIRDRLGEILPDTRLISYYGAAEIGFIGDSREGDGTWITIYPSIGAQIRSDLPSPGSGRREPGQRESAQRESGTEVPEGELGTLWIHAAACSYGYVTGTTEAVLRGADGWATVDDQGRIDNGMLQLAGRAGDIAITGGHKVSLPEVERAFETYGHLGEVCAIALDDPALGSIIALVVEGDAPAAEAGFSPSQTGASKTALIDHARARLAPQFVPRRIYRLEHLPRTVGGKIRRAETVDLIMDGQGQRL
ncbi:Acyl-CoA synthetase (AMP-forming)/AMP-acid ligase II [Brevibacterium sandarakinum]|uniref:Acyl-CoA synthetase (AMP-forming)/AMP-acid ligase II n=1 Tax=Brevibacterium sandarakinum TaxID=629680 RepID=A0A1H1RIP0_BRESA|nr:class I adenylate-forming enzyme family protein [Brevibacterium sandarakinum]SDS34809.1 Acyl-CoA synthetase (AMP-forming)/AMP-acid ligase II [Brevibacterium sandarakinum]